MSDNEYEMEWASDEGGQADNPENGDDIEIQIQNNFYEAEGEMKQKQKTLWKSLKPWSWWKKVVKIKISALLL